jgi:hypothetical protein
MDEEGGLALPPLARDEQPRAKRFVKRVGLHEAQGHLIGHLGPAVDAAHVGLGKITQER